MKPILVNKKYFKAVRGTDNHESFETFNDEKAFNFPDFIVPKPMTQQEVEPPSYIWDRIAKALDEQESLNKVPDEKMDVIGDHPVKKLQRNTRWLAAVLMCIGVVILSVK